MEAIRLNGTHVELIPLDPSHADALFTASQHEEIWTHMTVRINSKEDTEQYIQKAMEQKQNGMEYPFVIIEKATTQIIGTTRYLDISPQHKRLEIGGTWLARTHWRSKANTECKYMLLTHAFENMDIQRVQIKTDQENLRSQQAIERIGATKEGIFRNHMVRLDGSSRNSVIYSIISEDWPNVRQHLEQLLNR